MTNTKDKEDKRRKKNHYGYAFFQFDLENRNTYKLREKRTLNIGLKEEKKN